MYSTISKIIPAQKITVNLVVFNLGVKMHNGRSRNYYKVGFNFRLEIIRLKLAKFRLNIPIGNWAQAIPAVLSEIWPSRRIVPNKKLPTDRSHWGPARAGIIIPEDWGPVYHTEGPLGPAWPPIGPPVVIPVHRKGPIGPVCDLIKQGFSSSFCDSESSTTSKFIYVLRLGITPLMLKSFISSVRLVNSLY